MIDASFEFVNIVGSLNYYDIRNNRNCKQISTGRLRGIFLVLLHASWNKFSKNEIQLFFENIKSQLKEKLQEDDPLRSFSGGVGLASVLVDDDDDALEFYIEDSKALKAPETLPSLAVVFFPRSFDNLKLDKLPMEYIQLNATHLQQSIRTKDVEMNSVNMSRIKKMLDDAKEAMVRCRLQFFREQRRLEIELSRNKLDLTLFDNVSDEMVTEMKLQEQIRIFVAGDRSQVGKSSVCMGLLGKLLLIGYSPESLAYIKPATQCEKPQLVTEYCQKKGISCIAIGPIVFYKGFTREFLSGNTNTTQNLLSQASQAVDSIAVGKKIVIIDGVGYPAVGSICGTDNATIARVCGSINENRNRMPAPVLLVGKSGVGDAIDSYNLNATYFESKNVPVLGAIFNRLSRDGYYSLENCKNEITKYFSLYKNNQHVFGFIPEIPPMVNLQSGNLSEEEISQNFIDIFAQQIDVAEILKAAKMHMRNCLNNVKAVNKVDDISTLETQQKEMKKIHTREQIEEAAGATAGG